MIRDWSTRSSREVADCRVFRVSEQERIAPRTGNAHRMFVIHAADWVNVLPVTQAGEIVLIRQFRHGTREVTLEIPGGMIDATDADPIAAGRRELLEETGYDATDFVHVGSVHPNPAIQDNVCHTVLALGARQVAEPEMDGGEDIETVLHRVADLDRLITDGSITHALVVAAVQHLGRYRAANPDAV